jgi:hypothetical protein
MLTRLLTAIRPRPTSAAPAEPPGSAPPDTIASSAPGPADDDTAGQMRTIAGCCADGLTALAYAQFADLIEPPCRRDPPVASAAERAPSASV